MLAPKQFDPVNRDLEIRDLFNMEDAFHLADGYLIAYRARLNANLAFWDSLDGNMDWPADGDGVHPLTELVLADFLVVDVTKPYVEQGSFLEIERAAPRGVPHETCGGRAPNDDVMDTLFTLLVNAGQRSGRSATASTSRRGQRRTTFPYLSAPNPDPPALPEHHYAWTRETATAHAHVSPRARRHPERRAARTAVAVRRHLPSAPDRRPRRGPGARAAAAPAGRLRPDLVRPGGRRLDHRRVHLPRA